uniref:Oxysterol-binding protein n=1 Tax=Propithecus coquereli TaxID=379532 RepID=A0A2K6F9Y3_PROCO
MPIAFNEPLSFLQRITEYMEHVYLLHKACRQPQPLERMQSVAAFAVSAVASQWERTGKPFNPLLGETYELIREDLGFRFISEQVSHHPPISAFYSEGLSQDFLFHGSIYPKLKFWGKSVEAEPRGTITLELLKHNEAYTWTNPTCCVHNVIIGKLWIEQYGTVEIVNHRTGHKCVLNFKPCGLFGKELHKVEGHIQDKNKQKLFVIYGKWTECLWGADPASYESFKKRERSGGHPRRAKLVRDDGAEKADSDVADDVPEVQETVQVVPGSKLLWRINTRPPNSAQTWPARRRSGWRRSREKPGGSVPGRRQSGRPGGSTRAPTPTRGLPTGCTRGITLSGTSLTAQISTEDRGAPGPRPWPR